MSGRNVTLACWGQPAPQPRPGQPAPSVRKGAQGPQSLAGTGRTSVTIHGTVADVAVLPTNLTSTQKGRGYLTDNYGHLHVRDGPIFTDVGVIRGPARATGGQGPIGATGETGAAGPTGSQGANRSGWRARPQWVTGNGAPGSITGALPGDLVPRLDHRRHLPAG